MISSFSSEQGTSVLRVKAPFRIARQQGSALIFALMTLVALMLAAVALVRSVDTGSRVLGNLGFKQDATAAADKATAAALASLSGIDLNANLNTGTVAYYATALDGVDTTGQQIQPGAAGYATRSVVNWDLDNCAYAPSPAVCAVTPSDPPIAIDANTTARFFISRLCLTAGDPSAAGNTCQRPLRSSTSAAPPKGSLDYAHYERFAGVSGPYYRIVVRVVGARGTTSFTETIVHF
jgi:type IV pilus assembly protein PilX